MKLLHSRIGALTTVTLKDGSIVRLTNIAVKSSIHDEDFNEVLANVGPPESSEPFEPFYTADVLEIADAEGTVLFRGSGA